MKVNMNRLLIIICLLLQIQAPFRAHAADLGAAADAIDNYVLPAYPIIYGEIVEKFSEEEMKNVNLVLKGVEIFGYCKALGDIANKVDSGDNLGASLDLAANGANLAITLLKDEATKKVMIGSIAVGALPLTGLLTAIDIARKSSEAVQSSKTALDLERLYYSVENDQLLKVKGRELGQGDPIRVDSAAVEHLWRKVMNDEKWSELLKNYVTNELSQDWPEPSLWEQITLASNFLREDALLQEKTRLKGHIAGLLRQLNNVAKKREATVLVSQMLKEISAMTNKISVAELSNAFSAYSYALKELPRVKVFVDGLPQQVSAYQARVAKASAAELTKLKETEMLQMLGGISGTAAIVQKLPSKGRYASVRQDLLTRLEAGYKAVAGVRNSVLRAEINVRLAEEAKKLASEDTEFRFSRYDCGKSFDDVKGDFAQLVLTGDAGAGEAVNRVKDQIRTRIDDITPKYQKDLEANQKIYGEKASELSSQLQRLYEQGRKAVNSNEQDQLDRAIVALSGKIAELNDRYGKYNALYTSTTTVDIEGCTAINREIDAFVAANANRFNTVIGSLNAYVADASRKWFLYQEEHLHKTNGLSVFLVPEINELEKTMADNPASYIGISFTGLKTKLVKLPEASKSRNLIDTMAGINDTLYKQVNGIYSFRMHYYSAYDIYYRKNLHYMESPQSKEDLKVVTDAIAAAEIAINGTQAEDIQSGAHGWLDGLKEGLRQLRAETAEFDKALNRGSGLAAGFDQYCIDAVRINGQITEDSDALFAVLRRFQRAYYRIDGEVRDFLLSDAKDRVLDGSQILRILDEHEILDFSKKAGIGIETIVSEVFYEIRSSKGLVSIEAKHLTEARNLAESLPVTDYQQFFDKLISFKEKKGEVGVLFEKYFEVGQKFVTMFQIDPKLGEEAKKLFDIIVAKRDIVMKKQADIDEKKARFDLILQRATQLKRDMDDAFARKSYDNVTGIGSFLGDIKEKYQVIGATRSDIDQVLDAITQMMVEARRLQTSGADEQFAQIREFYGRFREAYEARNDSLLISFIADDWQAGDGTTLADLQGNLSRSFRVFDEISYQLSNLNAIKASGWYNVTYDVTITSRIYRRNIKHVEKSQVTEMVAIDAQGKPKITRTLNGRYWTVE